MSKESEGCGINFLNLKKAQKFRPPVPGCLCNESGSISPSPDLRCQVWGHGLALVLERGVREQGREAESVQSPHSNVRGRWWLQSVQVGRWGAIKGQDGPRF